MSSSAWSKGARASFCSRFLSDQKRRSVFVRPT
jgi:hypothetical protein